MQCTPLKSTSVCTGIFLGMALLEAGEMNLTKIQQESMGISGE
jgi:hypothetical protein